MNAESPSPLLAGRYRLEQRLGRGGMGEVWAAHDNVLDRAVAVKLLRDDRATQDPTLRARFVSEARASARFHHPNVVDVFDAGADEDSFYLVMERLPGRSLGHQIKEAPLTADEARAMSADILAGLGAAHAANLVHRDIKPPNILKTEDGRWKLVDFGIAKSLDDTGNLTATGITIGSPSYLAPEQIQGDAATLRCDIWAMGVVLYESLAGHKPFRGDTPYALAEAVCTTEPTPLGTLRPDLDPGLVGVVDRALSKPPEQRFGSAAEMAEALRSKEASPAATPLAAAAAEPTRAAPAMAVAGSPPPPPAPAPPLDAIRRPPDQRRPVALWIGAAVVLALVLAAAAYAAKGGGDDGGQGDTTTTTTVPGGAPTSAGDDGTGTSSTPETTEETSDTAPDTTEATTTTEKPRRGTTTSTSAPTTDSQPTTSSTDPDQRDDGTTTTSDPGDDEGDGG
jgi:serine/threonine-protein kinase